MSFDYDPYAVMTVVKNADNTFSFRCDSCGGGWRNKYPPATSLEVIRAMFDAHVITAHRLTRGQTAAWHQGF